MLEKNCSWLSSRVSLGEALNAIGVPDVGDLELSPSSNALAFKCNGLVYRFATSKWQARRMQREQALLERIGPRLSLMVPEIVRSSSRPVFHAYHAIAGVGLDQVGFARFEPARRERVLATLARFLVELHRCDTGWCRPNDRETGSKFAKVATEAALDHYDSVDPGGTARRFVEETIERYAAARPDGATAVLVHDDLVNVNILVDPQSGDVTGIVDFTEWLVGDHHRDFSRLRRFGGDDGLRTIARIYEEDCGRQVNLDFVMVIERLRLCHNLLRMTEPPQARVDRMVRLMKTWQPLV